MSSSPPVIVASRADPASQNIAQTLIAQHSFTEFDMAGSATIYHREKSPRVVIEKQCIHAEPDDIPLKGPSMIFASKHVSEAQRPALTVHATGNLTKQAEFGGRPEEVPYVEPFRLKTALRRLQEEAANARVQIEVTMEATHHGPTSFLIPISSWRSEAHRKNGRIQSWVRSRRTRSWPPQDPQPQKGTM